MGAGDLQFFHFDEREKNNLQQNEIFDRFGGAENKLQIIHFDKRKEKILPTKK